MSLKLNRRAAQHGIWRGLALVCGHSVPQHYGLPVGRQGHCWRHAALAAVLCSAVQCSAVQCSAVQCSAVQCSAVQCSPLLYAARPGLRSSEVVLTHLPQCERHAQVCGREAAAPNTAERSTAVHCDGLGGGPSAARQCAANSKRSQVLLALRHICGSL